MNLEIGHIYLLEWDIDRSFGWAVGEYLRDDKTEKGTTCVFLCLSYEGKNKNKYQRIHAPMNKTEDELLTIVNNMRPYGRPPDPEIRVFDSFFKDRPPRTKITELTVDDLPLYMVNATNRFREVMRGV